MIFVTGGTGLLGNNVLRELAAQGQHAVALCRKPKSPTASSADATTEADVPASLRTIEPQSPEIVFGDLHQADVLDAAIARCEAVIHSAAFIHLGWTKLNESRRVNVEGTRAIVESCLRHQKRLVYISTVDTLPAARGIDTPIHEGSTSGVEKVRSNYVVSKLEAEGEVTQAIEQRGLNAVILHPGFMLGPNDWKPSSGRMMLEIAKAPVVFAPLGGCSVTDVRDAAAAVVAAVHRGEPGEHFILGGTNISYRDLWKKMLELANRNPLVLPLGPINASALHLVDLWFRWTPMEEGDVNGAAAKMGMQKHYYDSAKAASELGYEYRDLDTILHDAWKWLQAHHVDPTNAQAAASNPGSEPNP